MKPTLNDYLSCHEKNEFKSLANSIDFCSEIFGQALLVAETADDYIALKTVAQRQALDDKQVLFDKVSLASANADYIEQKRVYEVQEDINTISFVTNFPVDQHLNMLSSYVCSLLVAKPELKVNVIITGESDWFIWRGSKKENLA